MQVGKFEPYFQKYVNFDPFWNKQRVISKNLLTPKTNPTRQRDILLEQGWATLFDSRATLETS